MCLYPFFPDSFPIGYYKLQTKVHSLSNSKSHFLTTTNILLN